MYGLTVLPPTPAAGCLLNFGGDAQAGSCVACPTGSQQNLALASVTNGATNPVTCSELLPSVPASSQVARKFASSQAVLQLDGTAEPTPDCKHACSTASSCRRRLILFLCCLLLQHAARDTGAARSTRSAAPLAQSALARGPPRTVPARQPSQTAVGAAHMACRGVYYTALHPAATQLTPQ